MRGMSTQWRIHWILRVAIAAEFIGHGAFGIIGKEAWLAYYDALMVPRSFAQYLMPLTGMVDITLGLLILFRPMRATILYMACWGLFTASLRPLAGEGGWELVERSYNYGVPLVLLMLIGPGTSVRHWFERVREIPPLTYERARSLAWGLRAIIAAYLVGHGSLGVLTGKPVLVEHYESVGLTSLVSDPQSLNEIVGLFEIGLGLLVLAAPATGLLLFVLAWKLATEMLHVTAGAYGAGFEVIERGSAYAAPLALIYIQSVLTAHQAPTQPAPAAVLTSAHRSVLMPTPAATSYVGTNDEHDQQQDHRSSPPPSEGAGLAIPRWRV